MSQQDTNNPKPESPQFDLNLEKQAAAAPLSGWWRGRHRWRLSPYLRVRLLLSITVLVAVGLIYNLYTLQAQDGGNLKLSERAAQQNIKTENVPAPRGQIRSADGLLMATNIPTYDLYSYPDGLTAQQTARVTAQLAPFLPDVPVDTLKDKLTFKDKDHLWQPIAKGLDDATITKIQALNPAPIGITIIPTTKRVYPNGTLLGHLLGFVHNGDNESDGLVGAYGVEGFYDSQLKGTPGKIIGERDVNGNPLPIDGSMQIQDPVAGDDLTLTIDSGVQRIVDRELAAGMKEYKADMGTIIVMNPNNGAILGYANSQVQYPAFDPNNWSSLKYEQLLDPVVSNVYEPGSTFKIFTAAIGMDTGAVQPDSAADLPGCQNRYGAQICNWNSVGHTHQTVVDTLRFSSNVGADWIADHIKPEVFYDYLHKFGFAQPSGVDLQGEAAGIMPVPGTQWWIPLTYYQQAFGQGIAVTPIQLVAGVAAVANGGRKVQPHVVAQITHDGKLVQQNNISDGPQLISPETSKKMNDSLTEAMTGDGSETALVCVPGYKLAAKTGTAQIPLKGGGYEDGGAGHTIGSTIAYGPSDNPQVLVYVRFDRTKDIEWGSNTAGPVVHNVMSDLMTYYKIPPSGPNTCRYYK